MRPSRTAGTEPVSSASASLRVGSALRPSSSISYDFRLSFTDMLRLESHSMSSIRTQPSTMHPAATVPVSSATGPASVPAKMPNWSSAYTIQMVRSSGMPER